ncbi:hypothetical protein D3C73_1324510 [compost metagenome]
MGSVHHFYHIVPFKGDCAAEGFFEYSQRDEHHSVILYGLLNHSLLTVNGCSCAPGFEAQLQQLLLRCLCFPDGQPCQQQQHCQ